MDHITYAGMSVKEAARIKMENMIDFYRRVNFGVNYEPYMRSSRAMPQRYMISLTEKQKKERDQFIELVDTEVKRLKAEQKK